MSNNDHQHRYARSKALLDRAMELIPLGTQTFSKSVVQYPAGHFPAYIERAQGARVWDVDGNEYVDFVNGLLSVSLGYADPDVDRAVREQLDKGVTFSLPPPVEVEVTERIIDMVPSAETVRFGKNGSDVTAGAVRAARAFTGRDHVAVCGYHGWQDWYIGTTTRDLGVPADIKSLTHSFNYNDLDSLRALFRSHDGLLAAVVMEPMTMVEPEPSFLEGVRTLTREHGTLLVFDEVITGFRFARGGAQELFGVTPDLTALGKGLANGYPLSALAGRADVMEILSQAFFSFTMGSEALSLAAANATLAKLDREPVLETIHERGRYLKQGVERLLQKHAATELMQCVGHPSWTSLAFKDANGYRTHEIKSLWMQEVIDRGILTLGTHNMSYAHTENDVNQLLAIYDTVIPILKKATENRALRQCLRFDPIEPVFQVR